MVTDRRVGFGGAHEFEWLNGLKNISDGSSAGKATVTTVRRERLYHTFVRLTSILTLIDAAPSEF